MYSSGSTEWKNAHGRTLEGTGIGLALVQELVITWRHGSRSIAYWAEATMFRVTLPFGELTSPPTASA